MGDADPRKPNCSHRVSPNAKFCPECGKPVGFQNIDEQIKQWIKERRFSRDEFMYGWDTDNGACSWYDWIEDMVKISRAFPQVIFVVEGWGEETGDWWRAHFVNGKYAQGKATLPAFKLEDLRPFPHT